MLAAFTLDAHTSARGDMRNLHSRLCFVDVLPTSTTTPASLPVNVTFINVQIVSFRLRQDCNRDGRRVNSALAQTLASMATRLKTEETGIPFMPGTPRTTLLRTLHKLALRTQSSGSCSAGQFPLTPGSSRASSWEWTTTWIPYNRT